MHWFLRALRLYLQGPLPEPMVEPLIRMVVGNGTVLLDGTRERVELPVGFSMRSYLLSQRKEVNQNGNTRREDPAQARRPLGVEG